MGYSSPLAALAVVTLWQVGLAGPCLCIFDIDRTLTGKQGDVQQCPGNVIVAGAYDDAYGGGTLTLSPLAQRLNETFCAACYIGTISAGTASGPGSAERQELQRRLSVQVGRLPTADWSVAGCAATSPLDTSCPDGTKQTAVPSIVAWYRNTQGVIIASEDVHFFDDRSSNVAGFQGQPYNARQIACAQRDMDGEIGLCGASVAEVVGDKGIAFCSKETSETRERRVAANLV
mmetsp:Transcript_53869/g.99562  ORF Transcript_53869/g.99562 Transcript_53869/m.99562 type:complete len:232 (-) Transcript_53869:66-761(-)